MLGTIVNAIAIIIGSIIGQLIKGLNPEKFNDTIIKGLALCVMLIGISGALESSNILLLIFSIGIGAFIGEVIDIDSMLQKLGDSLEKRFNVGKISEGFVTATLIYCVGAMAIVGSLESGLTGNHETLYAKSTIDGISSIIFSSSLGIGVMLSSISVFIYQGIITLGAGFLRNILLDSTIREMSAVGSLLIVGIGLNMVGNSKIKVANLLPAVLIPFVYQVLLNILGK
ncbi:DUF554 domain-containing protein [Alkalithermobacter paradoxus]|uniref:Putative membrane protein YdfK n=1 Tax=Alkalithermobacter paradoxus TaxID=29349 RepID=A0A1V4I7P1_9FIRM|nr:putative membrane protein YdfK [[Clostridium] thermoalcaliphilum]